MLITRNIEEKKTSREGNQTANEIDTSLKKKRLSNIHAINL
jgi:hypothetical protein